MVILIRKIIHVYLSQIFRPFLFTIYNYLTILYHFVYIGMSCFYALWAGFESNSFQMDY